VGVWHASGQNDANLIDRDWTRFFRIGLAFAAAALLAVAAVIVVHNVDTTGAGSRGTQEGSCEVRLRFRGVLYSGQGLDPNVSLKHGQVLGEGTLPGCNDTQPPPGATDVPEEQQVAVVALEGIAPSIALAPIDGEQGIFVAAGRCAGYDSWVTRLGCLREPLLFEGRMYAPTSLRTTRVEIGAAIGSGRLRAEEVLVRRITSISPREAVATAGDGSVIYLSDEGCFRSPGRRSFEQDLLACLTTNRD